MVNALPVMSVTASIHTMVILSIERVRCVIPPRGHNVAVSSRSLGIRGAVIGLAIVWMSSIVMAVPAAVNFDISFVNDSGESNLSVAVCHSTWSSYSTAISSLIVLVVSYLLPQAILYVNYGRLAAYLWHRSKAVSAARAQPQTGARQGGDSTATPPERSTLKAIKMVATIGILALFAWCPYFTITTIEVVHLCFLNLYVVYFAISKQIVQ